MCGIVSQSSAVGRWEQKRKEDVMAEINRWKINKYPVSADVAKAEFDRIYEKFGELTAKSVVDENREKAAPLHSCFEWDDAVAAERYREKQAGDMIRCLVTIRESESDGGPVVVRALVKTTEKYEPITVAIKSEEKYAVLLQDALNDAKWFMQKHAQLVELKNVFEAIREFESKIKEAI